MLISWKMENFAERAGLAIVKTADLRSIFDFRQLHRIFQKNRKGWKKMLTLP